MRAELGEIAVRGDGLFSAYYAPWQLREDVEHNGWFMTGDIGWLDQAGALHLKGRKKAVIFVAGLKFFPEEVEDCITSSRGSRSAGCSVARTPGWARFPAPRSFWRRAVIWTAIKAAEPSPRRPWPRRRISVAGSPTSSSTRRGAPGSAPAP